MLLDALAWNVLNVIRVEFIFNCYKLWDVFMHSSFKSPRGQHAVASSVITSLALFTFQFQFSWLLRIYAIYLSVGICCWLYRRVYFYHRKLDPLGVNQTINNFDANKYQAASQAPDNTATFRPHKSTNGASHGASSSSSSASASSSSSAAAVASGGGSSQPGSSDTNSLQRQRAVAYRDFRSLLTEPRQNPKEFALSLAHLAHISGLFFGKDVFDEMHFQILATRRDVVNILLRSLLLLAATILAYVS